VGAVADRVAWLSAMADDVLTRRLHGQPIDRPTTVENVIQLQPFQGYILEVRDEHFHHDSPVLLPDYPAEDPPPGGAAADPSVGIAVLAECLRHSHAFPNQKLLVAGHADTSGPDAYNITISKKRANGVLHAILGERDPWVDIAVGQHKVEDYQLIFKWVAQIYGWDCDPGPVNNVQNSATTAATKKFQERYNLEFEANIGVDGTVGKQTWGAIFDVYMDALQNLLETDEDGVKALRDELKTRQLPPKLVGCGENFPIEEKFRNNYKSRINRRVELLFFDPGQEPKTDCHPGGNTCTPILCEIYNTKMYSFTPLPVPASLPRGNRVFLKLTYLDPEGNEKNFPPNFPVTVEYPDGTTQVETVIADGQLQFGAQRKSTFKLRFESAARQYIATHESSGDRLGADGDVVNLHNAGYKFFSVPLAWTMKQSDWTVTEAPEWDAPNFNFRIPGRIGRTIRTLAAPGKLKLDPHWTFVRFEFFDRMFGHTDHAHKRVNTPAMLIDGFRSTPQPAQPDVRSHWTINDSSNDDAVHCVPWILQFLEDRTAEPKPDTQMQLELVNSPVMHVISDSATSRRIAVVSNANDLKPSENRLKFYDLPPRWKSKKYFVRFKDNTGDFFESITQARIDDSKAAGKPLIFSLDDMVLVDASFNPIVLAATEDPVVFFHQFKDPGAGVADKPISPAGVYSPGADVTKPYFPYSDITMTVRSYVNDYPNWTRLIAAQGNLFDVFDQRTPEMADRVVGARAAVRWVDASPTAVGQQADGTVSPRPGRTPKPATDPFFVIQPFFEQRRDQNREVTKSAGVQAEWTTPFSGSTFSTGRVDLVLLRDCDVKDGKEIALNLHYFRFWLDFSSAPGTLNQQTFRSDVVTNIPKRWNGPDGGFNPSVPLLKPEDAGKKLEIGMSWFVQDLPSGKQHFHISVISVNRANMHGGFGTGQYGPGVQSASPNSAFDEPTVIYPGWFTAAHECGHGDSLLDEYNERYGLCTYYERAFATWIDGDPYEDDKPAMMRNNQDIRGRHYWHAVEWVRAVSGIDLHLEHGGSAYKLPHHKNQSAADLRTFVTWPFWAEVNVTGALAGNAGQRRKFDMYLYKLGNDAYAKRLVTGQTLQGILMVETKILVLFDDPNVTFTTIRDTLTDMSRAVGNRFTGVVTNNAIVDGSGVDFSPCLVVFRPRFLVQTFPSNIADPVDKRLQLQYCSLLGLSGIPSPAGEPQNTQYLTNVAPGNYAAQFNTVRSRHPEYFQVNIRDTYASAWDSPGLLGSIFGSGPTNSMKLRSGNAFAPFFGDMVGLNMTDSPPAAPLLKGRIQDRIVRRAMSNATIA
jgi:hypothetical protein